MAIPTNLSAATALVITTLPYTNTLDAFEVPNETLWFKYDTTLLLAFTAVGLATPVPIDTGTYVPQVDVFTGTPEALTPYLDMVATNASLSLPRPLATGTTFFFSIQRATGSAPFTERVKFQLWPGPTTAAPAESILVSDDSHGYPAVVVSSTTGEVLQTFPFPSGETADRLSSGVSLWHDALNDVFALYSPQFAPLATVAWAPLALPGQAPIQAGATQFYVGHPGRVSPLANAVVTTVSAAGVVGDTTWDLGAVGLFALAPNRAETILYYRPSSSGLVSVVKRWDLVNDVALSDLVATDTGFSGSADLIVLTDDSILVPWRATVGSNVKRYSAAGALLNTYAMTEPLNRIARSSDNLTTFWVWLFPDADYSTFQQIRISDGVVLHEVTSPQSDDGVLRVSGGTTPVQGPSNSCPFITTPEALPAITETPGGGGDEGAASGVRYVDVRRLRRGAHLSDEQKWLFHRRFQLDLETGVGLNDGQGSDPQIMLRWSDDGGHTWSNEHWMSAGPMGQYRRRAIWRQMGRSRDRIYEVAVSDPVAWNLLAAYIDVDAGTS